MLDQVNKESTRSMVLGNHAIAMGLIDGGIGYAAAYPGTPSTEVMEYLVEYPNKQFHAEWSTNEAVAMEEAISASITGVDSVYVSKSVGLNVAMDPLMTISNSGTEGALVLVVADDPGMHSSQNEQDTRVVAANFAGIPIFEPSSAQEAYYYARKAIKFSREFKVPVLLRTVTRLSHALAPISREPPEPIKKTEYVSNVKKFVSIPANARGNHTRMLRTRERIRKEADASHFWSELVLDEQPDYLVVTSGNSANYAIEAVKELDISAHIFVPKLIHPLPPLKLEKLLHQYNAILVIEELEPFLEEKLRIICTKLKLDREIIGKGILTENEGELTIDKVKQGLANYFDLSFEKQKVELPVVDDLLRIRPPVLCAGCPHRSTYVELGEALKSYDPIFHNDIGCYSLGVMPPHKAADTLICMGASIPMATASSITEPDRLAVAVIGDSTFWHSGLSGLSNAIWKDADIMVFVVDNTYTAMTGGQPNPSSHGDKMDIAKVAEAMGAKVWKINPM